MWDGINKGSIKTEDLILNCLTQLLITLQKHLRVMIRLTIWNKKITFHKIKNSSNVFIRSIYKQLLFEEVWMMMPCYTCVKRYRLLETSYLLLHISNRVVRGWWFKAVLFWKETNLGIKWVELSAEKGDMIALQCNNIAPFTQPSENRSVPSTDWAWIS